jgi:hypothetical protein
VSEPKVPMYNVAAQLPSLQGWRVLAFAHDTEGKRIEMSDDRFAVVEYPVIWWGVMVPLTRSSAFFGMFGGGGDPPPCPLDAEGNRLDKIEDYIGISPPGETAVEAIFRIEEPIREAAKRAAEREQKR